MKPNPYDISTDLDLSGGSSQEETSQETSTEATEASTETVETNTEEAQTEQTQTQETKQETADQTSAASETDSTSTEETTSTQTTETESTESTQNETEVEVSEELILKSLSEKLGREVTSFDDLTETSNPLDSDEYLKKLVEWREKTGRPIEDYVKFQKDYSQVADLDIAREFLQLEHPELSPEDIDLELNHKYISNEDDLESDAALKNLELKKLVAKGRTKLQSMVADLGNPIQQEFSPEVKQDLEIAKQYKAKLAENKQANIDYTNAIAEKATSIKSIQMDLAEGVSLEFKLPENSSKSLVDSVQNAPSWKNEDGSWNHEAIIRDAAIIANYKDMLKIAYEQGKNSGTDETIREAKNSTLGNRTQSDAALPNNDKGVVIEGLDNYLGSRGMKIKSRK